NRLFVLIQWSWSYLTFARGTRLIVEKEWRSYPKKEAKPVELPPAPSEAAPPSRAPEGARLPTAPPREAPMAPPREALPPAPPVRAEEPVTRTWQAPAPPDVWEEPTTLYPSRE
ncbi:MAG TPA: hypothetical protein VNN80_33895, partial [Polyangiaceae bacterium]|nr:hypothetical protein [Polyangiaceae bacterium]